MRSRKDPSDVWHVRPRCIKRKGKSMKMGIDDKRKEKKCEV